MVYRQPFFINRQNMRKYTTFGELNEDSKEIQLMQSIVARLFNGESEFAEIWLLSVQTDWL